MIEAIAQEIRNLAAEADNLDKRTMLVLTAERVAEACARYEVGFDRGRFLQRCGL